MLHCSVLFLFFFLFRALRVNLILLYFFFSFFGELCLGFSTLSLLLTMNQGKGVGRKRFTGNNYEAAAQTRRQDGIEFYFILSPRT